MKPFLSLSLSCPFRVDTSLHVARHPALRTRKRRRLAATSGSSRVIAIAGRNPDALADGLYRVYRKRRRRRRWWKKESDDEENREHVKRKRGRVALYSRYTGEARVARVVCVCVWLWIAKRERERERAGISSREAVGSSPWKFTGARVTATCLWLVRENLGSLGSLASFASPHIHRRAAPRGFRIRG